MPDFLTFTLAAPMASFGMLAGNERRGTQDRPGHSLLVGLVGAALGLQRDDPKLEDLGRAAQFAVLQRGAGAPLRDYHTVQTVRRSRAANHATRREALRTGPTETALLTHRDYVTDVLCFVAMALQPGAPASLEACRDALHAPHFTLYFGRKSCPLALPLAAQIRAGCADARQALTAQEVHHRESKAALLWPVSGARRPGTVSGDPATLPSGADGRLEQRRSRPGSRANWQYGLLEEMVLSEPEREEEG